MSEVVAELVALITADTTNLQKGMGEAKGALGELSSALLGFGSTMEAAMTPFVAALGASVIAAGNNERALVQLDAVIKSTGVSATNTTGAIHLSRQAYIDLAQSLQEVTRYSDETILKTESLLLTFTKIGSDIFPQVTEAALNMSEALGQDVKTSAIQLGKALQNPITGLMSLRRAGISFTADQEKLIKSLMATGDVLGAQKVILKEVETEFGGMARAVGDTLQGRLAQVANAFQDIAEAIGYALLPMVSGIAQAITTFAQRLTTVDPAVIQFTAAIVTFGMALGAAAIAIGLLLSPFGPLLIAIAAIQVIVVALAAAFASNFGGIRDTVNKVIGSIQNDLGTLKAAFQVAFDDLFPTPADMTKQWHDVLFPDRVTGKLKVDAVYQLHVQEVALGANDDMTGDMLRKAFKADKAETEANSFGNRLAKAFKDTWPTISLALVDLGGKILAGIGELVGKAAQWVLNVGAPALGVALLGFAAQVWATLTVVVPPLIASAWANLRTAFETGVGDIVTALTASGHGDIVTSISTLFTNIQTAFNNAKVIIEGIWTDLQPHVANLVNGVQGFFDAFKDVDWSGVNSIIQTGIVVIGVGLGLLVTVFGAAIKALMDALGDTLPKIGKGIAQIVNALADITKGNAVKGFQDLGSGILGLGLNIALFPVEVGYHIAEILLKFAGIDLGAALGGWKPFIDWLGAVLSKAFTDAGHAIDIFVSALEKVPTSINLPGVGGVQFGGGGAPNAGDPVPTGISINGTQIHPSGTTGQPAGGGAGAGGGAVTSMAGAGLIIQPQVIAQALQDAVQQGAQQAEPANSVALGTSLGNSVSGASQSIATSTQGIVSQPIMADVMLASLWLNTIGKIMMIGGVTGVIVSMKAAVTAAAPQDIGNAIKATFTNTYAWLGTAGIAGASSIAGALVKVMGSHFAKVGQPLVASVRAALLAIAAMFNALPGGVGVTIAAQIQDAVAGARAAGGPVTSGKSYLVGERGPEIFTPRVSGGITPNRALANFGGGNPSSGPRSITIQSLYITGVQDADALLDQLEAAAERRSLRLGTPL